MSLYHQKMIWKTWLLHHKVDASKLKGHICYMEEVIDANNCISNVHSVR